MGAMFLALVIFGFTYVMIMTEWINKTTASLLGAFLIIVLRIVDQDSAFRIVDWNVIFLLIGMMIVMGILRETGVFQWIAIKTAKLAKASPLRIMLMMFAVTAVISAFLDNVTTVMILVPIAILIANELKITPVPFIITMAIASNIGGTATMIGDPPNILIGSATQYSFMDFIFNLSPVIIIITIVSLGITWLLYRKGMKVSNTARANLMSYREDNLIANRKLLYRSLVVVFLMLVAFMLQDRLHLKIATIAMLTAVILLIFSNRKKVDHVLTKDIDWSTIFFFIGLFIIVEALQQTGFIALVSNSIITLSHNDLKTTSMIVLWISGIFSAIIDNIPFVTTMIPMIQNIGTHFSGHAMDPVWWSLSLGACLGGNGTLIGASANIVSVGIAHKNGYKLSFWDFTKLGVIYTLSSLVISTAYILLRYF